MHIPFPRPRQQRGVTLIEALVAMLVLSLGVLAFAGLHSKLRVNSDVSRQRAEAVRKAQAEMEELREFASLATYDAIASTTQTYAAVAGVENTVYSLTRTISGAASAPIKHLAVRMDWTDRNNTGQSVTLRSSIARSDPKLAAAMSLPPNGSPVRDPLGRDVQIPIPAKNLGDGTSVFKPAQGGGLAFVFNNDTGLVTRKCDTSLLTATTTANISASSVASGATGCTDLTNPGYLLSGYIRFSLSNSPDPTNPNDTPPGPASIAIALDSTAPPSGSAPLGTLNRLNSSYWTPTPPSSSGYLTPDCGSEDSRTVIFTQSVNFSQINNGTTQTVTSTKRVQIVPASTPLTAAAVAPYAGLFSTDISDLQEGGERYIAYACVIYPIDLQGALAWTGRSTVVPSGWTIGTSSTDYKVCRYSTDYNLNGYVWSPNLVPATNQSTTMTKIDNAEHPNAYIRVTNSLSNQNFLVVKGNRNCPTDGPFEVDGQGQENYSDETTVLHQ